MIDIFAFSGNWCMVHFGFGETFLLGMEFEVNHSQQLCPFLPLQFEIDASLVLINSDKYVFNFG